MRTILTLLVLSLLVISVMPGVLATSTGIGVDPEINPEEFAPLLWMCDDRVVFDDNTEPGRLWPNNDCNGHSGDNDHQNDCELLERINNYAFEGEQLSISVLAMDKNGIEKLQDVYMTIGSSQGEGNDIEVNCQRSGRHPDGIPDSCNARILEEELDEFNPDLMEFYDCLFTVETSDSMYGEYWVTVEAEDYDGILGTIDENEYWFLNPVIALSIDGDMTFDEVRPGSAAYSDTLLVGNDADAGSGVMMDMFISGTDFYDSSSSGAMCPTTNQLALQNFRYFATSGAYSTQDDDGFGRSGGDGDLGNRDVDDEGYVDIGYGIGFNDPHPFYDGYELLQAFPGSEANGEDGPPHVYWPANILAPGAEMALTFKLDLPEPCNGNFDTGSIFFWGEAI